MLITNVTVLPGTGGPALQGVDVSVRDGRFESIVPATDAPRDQADVVDGSGKFLVPGLWEAHTHLRPLLQGDGPAALDGALREYSRRGITSVVDLGGPMEPFAVLRERRRREGPAGRARVLFAGPSFTGVNGWPLALHHNPAMVHQIASRDEAVTSVKAHLEGGNDVVKLIYDGEPGSPEKLPLEGMKAIVAEAHAARLRVMVHVHSHQDALDAVEAGADGVEHSFLPTRGRERAEAEQVTEALLRTGAYLTPTLAIWEQLGRAGDRSYLDELVADGCMTPDERAAFEAREKEWGRQEFPHHPKRECLERLDAALKFLPEMAAAGVKLVAGSDIAPVLSRPGAALRELWLLARAGLPSEAVLAAGSRYAAEKVGRGESLGTIEPGKVADAILLTSSPLEDPAVLVRPGHLVAVINEGSLSS